METVRNYFNPDKNKQWKNAIKYSYNWDIINAEQQPNLFVSLHSSPPSFFTHRTDTPELYTSFQQTYFKIPSNIILVFFTPLGKKWCNLQNKKDVRILKRSWYKTDLQTFFNDNATVYFPGDEFYNLYMSKGDERESAKMNVFDMDYNEYENFNRHNLDKSFSCEELISHISLSSKNTRVVYLESCFSLPKRFEDMDIDNICKLNEKMASIYTNGKNNYIDYVQETNEFMSDETRNAIHNDERDAHTLYNTAKKTCDINDECIDHDYILIGNKKKDIHRRHLFFDDTLSKCPKKKTSVLGDYIPNISFYTLFQELSNYMPSMRRKNFKSEAPIRKPNIMFSDNIEDTYSSNNIHVYAKRGKKKKTKKKKKTHSKPPTTKKIKKKPATKKRKKKPTAKK